MSISNQVSHCGSATSERLALIGPVVVAQLEVERLISSLRAAGLATGDAEAQLGGLVTLRQEIASAGAAELPGLHRAVGVMVASAAAVVQQAQTASAARAAETMLAAVESNQRAVRGAMDYTRGLSLRFASAEDERGYREREAERAAYGAAQPRTSEGQLNTAGAAVGQMADARAHGASGSEFDKRWTDLVASTEQLRTQLQAEGRSTEEFDQHLRDDLRRIMQAKGYGKAQIDAALASNPDPIKAAKAFVKDGGDIDALKNSVEADRNKIEKRPDETGLAQTQADAKDVFASLKATGVTSSNIASFEEPSHGVQIVTNAAGNSARAV